MALISKRNFKTVLGAAHLTLTAKKGESLLVKNVMVYEPTANYVSLYIEKTTVGFFRVASLLGNHLQIPYGRALHSHSILSGPTAVAVMANGALRVNAGGTEMANSRLPETPINTTLVRAMIPFAGASVGSETILQYLERAGQFHGYPVESGQTFAVELATGGTAVKIVEYDLFDEADMKADMPNGSKGSMQEYISYGDFGAVIQAQVNPILGQSNNPPEFPDFPFGALVPADRKVELIGILASDVSPALNAAANSTSTRYLRLMRGNQFLFDEDHNGLLYDSPFADSLGNENMIAEGYSVGGNYTQCDRRAPLMFDPPLVFNAGESLTVMWNTAITGAGAAISQELQEVAFILRMSSMAG
jgi:hypothetical protein